MSKYGDRMARGNDEPVMPGEPRGYHRDDTQMDGNPIQRFTPPTKGKGLQAREAVPARAADSGMERAMAGLADKTHPGRKR